MYRKRNVTVFLAFTLHHFELFPIEIQVLQSYRTSFHTAKSTAIKQANKDAVFEQFGILQHRPDFFFAQNNWKCFLVLYRWQSKVFIWNPFRFQQKPKSINAVFEVGLRWGFGLFLQVKQVVLNLFGIQLRGDFAKIQRNRSQVAGIIVESACTSSQDRDRPLKTWQQFLKTGNLSLGLV